MCKKLFILLFTIILNSYFSEGYSQINYLEKLMYADSLFENKQYTESMDEYELLISNNYFTPRMLVRLSLIKEGLGDYTFALYYLNLYYSKYPEKKLLIKMDELATKHNLEGYEYNDYVFLKSYYDRYFNLLLLGILIFTSVLLFLLLYGRKKDGLRWKAFLFCCYAGVLLYAINFEFMGEKAILRNNATLMSSPSAGAEIIGKIDKGNRVHLNSTHDIWCKINWQGKPAYIRVHNLLRID